VQEHCEAVNASSILQCLADFSADFNFDPKCQAILRKRIAQRMRDFRLNPSLQRACRHGSHSQFINVDKKISSKSHELFLSIELRVCSMLDWTSSGSTLKTELVQSENRIDN
jgi:hypothetical protein